MKKISLGLIALLLTLHFASKAQTWSGATPGTIYYNSGSVGVGGSTVYGRLTISAPDLSVAPAFSIRGASSTTFGWDFNLDDSVNGNLYLNRVLSGTSTNVLTFVRYNGSVGIGTSSPGERLNVNGNIRADGAVPYFNLYNTNWAAHSYIQNGVDQVGNTTGDFLSFLNPAGKGFSFSQGSACAMTIGISGSVGIGTKSPGAKLEIANMLAGAHNVNTSLLKLTDAYNSGANGQFFQVLGAGDGTNYTNVNLISNYGYLSLGARADGAATATNTLNVLSSGKVGIGTTTPDEQLSVYGKIHSQEVKVDLSVPGPDYVFKSSYKLPPLSEIKTFVDRNQHLPEIPTADDMAKNGIDLGKMNTMLLKKVEELTLYLIEGHKRDEQLQRQIDQLKRRPHHSKVKNRTH